MLFQHDIDPFKRESACEEIDGKQEDEPVVVAEGGNRDSQDGHESKAQDRRDSLHPKAQLNKVGEFALVILDLAAFPDREIRDGDLREDQEVVNERVGPSV